MKKSIQKFDSRKWKPIVVGVIVFAVVFTGLTAYQKATEKDSGDIILTGEADTGIAEIHEQDEAESDPGMDMIFVDVGGAVNISGLFALPKGSRVADAIEAAGGLTESAEVKYINRAYVLCDGDRLYVPTVTEVLEGNAPPTAGQVNASGGSASIAYGSSSSGGTNALLVNINTAGSEELQLLNGVGPATAQKIIDYRTKHGAFKRIEDLMNVSGIGAKSFEKLSDHVTV